MRGLFRFIIVGVTALAATALPTARSQAAGAQAAMQAGMLTCNVASGWGFIVVSWRDLKCVYSPSSRPPEHYTGKISKYGVDIGFSEGAVMIWVVVAPTSDIGPDALEGDYGGATAGAAIGVGGNANVLLGGLDKSIALQPLSLEGHRGLNLAAGIATMELKYVKRR